MRAALYPGLCLFLIALALPAAAQDGATDCDRLAGYDHTPRQPGFPGVARIADPDAAIAACGAAAFAPGADPFLNFLLARALEDADPQDPRLPGLIQAGAAASAIFADSRMGRLVNFGLGGLTADRDAGLRLAESSCAAHPDRMAQAGCNNLAAEWIDRPADDAQRTAGLALMDRTCKAGLITACVNSAEHAFNGRVRPQSLARAYAYRFRACDLGDALSCSHVGYALEFGEGVAADPVAANPFYARSCAGGDAYGCFAQGENLAYGIGVDRDWAAGLALLDRACQMGSDDGCYELNIGLLYGQSGEAADAPEDIDRARAYFDPSCAAGSGRSCTEMGYIHQHGLGVAPDVSVAFGFHTRACDLGDPMGCSNLGVHYGLGLGVPADPARAVALYRQACDADLGQGCLNLGDILSDATLGVTDPEGARAAFARACDLGEAEACDRQPPAD